MKDMLNYASTPQQAFTGSWLTMQKESFTFTLKQKYDRENTECGDVRAE